MTESTGPWTLSGMKDNNARHEAPMREFLRAVVRQPETHARFMNMLSMLEHMGSRKIMVSQMDDHRNMTEDMLNVLDYARFSNVDLIARSRYWNVGDKSGMKAYLQTMFLTLEEDELERKYGINEV